VSFEFEGRHCERRCLCFKKVSDSYHSSMVHVVCLFFCLHCTRQMRPPCLLTVNAHHGPAQNRGSGVAGPATAPGRMETPPGMIFKILPGRGTVQIKVDSSFKLGSKVPNVKSRENPSPSPIIAGPAAGLGPRAGVGPARPGATATVTRHHGAAALPLARSHRRSRTETETVWPRRVPSRLGQPGRARRHSGCGSPAGAIRVRAVSLAA
jgi:hypothetical protein